MFRAMTEVGAAGRGAYAEAREMARLIRVCRERVARLVDLSSPEHVVFTHNTSDALNLGVKGVLMHARRARGDRVRLHVVTTVMEHNSILRPLHAAIDADPLIEWTKVDADPITGLVDPADIARAVRPGETVLVCVNHASNVTGTLQDMTAIGRELARFGAGSGGADGALIHLVDGAQSLGHVPVDMRAMGIDLLAFPGHKGLLGPQGTGGLCIRPGVERRLATVREGGTGNVSEQETHPAMMPEKYEAGSHNAVGIAGLSEGVAWLLDRGVGEVRRHELELMAPMLEAISGGGMPGLSLLGPTDPAIRVGVLSVLHDSLSPQELSTILETGYGVLTRAGLHCAPLAHRLMGTSPDIRPTSAGATRLSLGPFLTGADAACAIDALQEICREQAVPAK
jgi:selenocysteine lyase/cysteine desulfurase